MAKLSLCLITKDEEQQIPSCLESAKEVADEIVVVDTGSKDDTVRVASRCGANVYKFPWCDDFAAAKNETLRHAKGEWVLALDADERLDITNCRKIRQLVEIPTYQAYLVQLRSPYTVGQSYTRINTALSIRLFRNTVGLQYRGRLHEGIEPRSAETEISMANTNVTIDHQGYRSNLQQKYHRNLSLLRQQNIAPDAFFRFDLARCYMGLRRYREAMKELKRGLETPGAAVWLQAQMYVLLGDLFTFSIKDNESALCSWQRAAELDRNIVAPRLRLGRAHYYQGEYDMALRQFESVATLLLTGSLRGARLDDEITLAEAYACLSTCYLRLGRKDAALDALVKSRTSWSEDETAKVMLWNLGDKYGEKVGEDINDSTGGRG